MHLDGSIDLGFDETKVLTREQIAELKQKRPELSADVDFRGTVTACGAPKDVPEYIEQA